jgi:multiple sugar transport system ATP-binding protein
MAGIVIDRISKFFGAAKALDAIALTIADGEFVALLGPSGCGKTTLLRIIAGLETRSEGRVLIGDRDVSDLRPADRGLAMVFQNYAVFPHMTVFENVAFGLRTKNVPEDKVKRNVARAAELLHIEPYLERYPAKLSGGQRQRVAVARALAVEPAVLLMDEPLSNLDALLRLEMRADLKKVLQEAGTTTVYVTHDQTEAMGLADRIAVMQAGKLVQVDAPLSVYATPASTFVGGFVGSPPMNFVPLTAENGAAAIPGGTLAAPVSGQLLLGFRGEDVALGPAGQGLPFAVSVTEPMGSHVLLTGLVGDKLVRVVAPTGTQVRAGEMIGLMPHPERIVWMLPETGAALPKRQ